MIDRGQKWSNPLVPDCDPKYTNTQIQDMTKCHFDSKAKSALFIYIFMLDIYIVYYTKLENICSLNIYRYWIWGICISWRVSVRPSAAGFRNMYICIWGIYDSWRLRNVHFLGGGSEGTDFGQKKNLNQRVYWFMV